MRTNFFSSEASESQDRNSVKPEIMKKQETFPKSLKLNSYTPNRRDRHYLNFLPTIPLRSLIPFARAMKTTKNSRRPRSIAAVCSQII